MAAEAGIPILAAEIQQRVPFAESLTLGQTVFEWAPSSAASKEIETLTEELLKNGEDIQDSTEAKQAANG